MKLLKYYYKIMLKYSSPSKRAQILKRVSGVKIGNNCAVFDNVSFGSEPYLIEIGNSVRITKGVTFITHDGGVWVLRNNGSLKDADIFGKITVGNNVHIGINAVIMPGVTIGDNVIIGVGSIVTKDIPANSIVAGVPAKVIKTLDEYYEKNKSIVDSTKNFTPNEKKEYLLKKFSI